MKSVTINALQFKKNSSGIGVMIRELFARYTMLTRRSCRVVLPKDCEEFPVSQETELIESPWQYHQSIRRVFFQTVIMGRKYGKNTVLLTTDAKTPFFLPRTCTLVPLITDLAVFRMPDVYQTSRVLLWKLQFKYLQRRSDFFLAISEFTKQEMVEILGISPDKIHVVPCAAPNSLTPVKDTKSLSSLKKAYSLPNHFLLFVGNANPRKNLARIIQAFDMAITRKNISQDLVIAGEQGWKFSVDEALKGVKNKERIHFIGFVKDEDMPALYSAADAFLFPTLYEGFGIPVIEAQMCGTPVLTSNCSSLPEVTGNAAIYVDPLSVESIYTGLVQVTESPILREELRQKGFQNAKRFSWDISAKLLDQFIESEMKNIEKDSQ